MSMSGEQFIIKEKKYKSVLIEGEKDRWEQLCSNMNEYDAICVNAFVESSGMNSLDNILKKTDIPYNFDLLSIIKKSNNQF